MSTFSDVIVASSVEPRTWVDDRTPTACFGATTKVLGVITTYLLRGEMGDPGATILGREELHEHRLGGEHVRPVAYLGERVKGGQPIVGSFAELCIQVRGSEQ